MRIEVAGDPPPCDLAPVRAAMRRAARPYHLPTAASVTLVFVDDDEMRALNARFRGIRRTTDVLSFGEELPPGAKGDGAVRHLARPRSGGGGTLELGDVVISTAQARRQARRARHGLAEEIAFLAAHGVLHLLGFEDETPDGYREMLRLGQDAVRQKSVNA